MYLGRFITLFAAVLLISASVSAKTVTFDGSSCAQSPLSPCKIDSMLATIAGALQATDDVIINGAKNAIYTIGNPLTCKSLNISNGVVNLASGLNLNGLLYVAPNAQLVIDTVAGIANCKNVKVDGSLLLKAGICNIAGLDLAGGLKLQGGQLNVNNLVCASTCIPNIVGGIIKHTGNCIYNAIPTVSGTAKFLVDGIVNLNKGIQCIDKCTVNMLKNSVANILGDSKILTPLDLDANAKFIVNKGTCALNGLTGDLNSVLSVVDGILNLNAPCKVPNLSLDGLGSVNVNTDVQCNNLKANANAKLNLLNNGLLKVATKADCNAGINLANTAQFIVDSNAVANLLGGMKCSDNSIFKVLDNCKVNMNKDNIFTQPISVGPKSILNLANGVTTCNKGINTDLSTIINLDKATCHLNNNANLGSVNLNTGANLNINGGNSIINGPFKCSKDSTAAITNALLDLKNKVDLDNILQLNTGAKLNLNGITNLNNGIHCADKTPIINVANQVNLNSVSDLKGLTNLNANAILNLNGAGTHSCNNINSDAKAALNVNKGCALKIDGLANLNGVNQLIDNAHLIVNGQTNLLSGLKCSGSQPSNLSVTKTGKCNFGAPTNINGAVLVDMGGNLIVDAETAIHTLTNNGNMVINKPCNILSDKFSQNDANSVINLNAGGCINAAKTLDLVKGTVNGVGALKCGTCNLGNNINANLNIDGDIVLQPTCNLVAKVNQATGTVVPMIVGTGKCVLNGVADLGALAAGAGKQAAAEIVRLISAPNVSGNLSIKAPAGGCAGTCPNWQMVIPDCKCACEFHRK
ncbi:hypothetical protein PPL_10094 [Heterostelium album PN500]|uniref:Uncharacterized protein n=1 Tax=Heterostelium pallidum (strain ATCC 26659 / Pp 5 / PN500) TaxID=670386 RepID=D3BQA9_HETP5|nr:hypothetical protein PPL_10094 [Heterostelium album PN500]EFA76329.1 hypothetical protein PPL_10094 [Heterostelium album PN500]|eukprot:XP_020428461.1 hypothetical protein PPL_10094 [Heterostelium album PN500]